MLNLLTRVDKYREITPNGSCGGSGGFITVVYPEAQLDLAKESFPGRYFKPSQKVQAPTRNWDHLVKCVKCWRETSQSSG